MRPLYLFALLSALSMHLQAAEDTMLEPQTPAATSVATWLELQRSGSQASELTQALPAPVMNKVYERYINSFSRPIPETYKHEALR